MDTLISQIPWQGFGWAGLIILVVLSIIKGYLIPKETHDTIVADLRESLALERESRKLAQQALAEFANQYGTTADRILNSLPLPPPRDDEDSEDRA